MRKVEQNWLPGFQGLINLGASQQVFFYWIRLGNVSSIMQDKVNSI